MSAQCREPLLAPHTEADQRGAGDAPPRAGRDPHQRASDAPPDSESVTARRLRARGLVGGEAPPRIASVIRDECGPRFGTTWIRAYRLALGITLADVVEQVRAWYEAEDRDCPRFSETLLSAYESGQKRPGPEYMHYLCAVYAADPEDLGYRGTCFCGRSHRTGLPVAAPNLPAETSAREPWQHPGRSAEAGPASPAGSDGVLACPDPAMPPEAAWVADDDDVLRRALLQLIAGAPVSIDARFFGAVDRVRRRMDDALFRGWVSATMLDQWEETAAGYGRQYMTVPPLRLLCDVLLDFGDVRRMCEQRQTIEFSERLCRLAAQLAGLTGMIMIDIGDQRMARSFFRTARIAADETGDRALRAWVTVREALIPLYYGDPREAISLARTGADLAGRTQCVAGVMAPVAEARALGRLAAQGKTGVLGRARASLGRAAEGLEALPAAQRGDTAFGYTERQFLFHEGDALVALGDHDRAEAAFGQSLRLYAPAEFLDRSLVIFGQARCKLETDEPEEALRVSRDTLLGLPPEHRAEIVVHAARALGDSAAARHGNVPAVREYREALITA